MSEPVMMVTFSLKQKTVQVPDTEQYDVLKKVLVDELDPDTEEVVQVEREVPETKTRQVMIEKVVPEYSFSEVVLSEEEQEQFERGKGDSKEAVAADKMREIEAAAISEYLSAKARELAADQLGEVAALLADPLKTADDIKAVKYGAAK